MGAGSLGMKTGCKASSDLDLKVDFISAAFYWLKQIIGSAKIYREGKYLLMINDDKVILQKYLKKRRSYSSHLWK